jgi:hypothetical protein
MQSPRPRRAADWGASAQSGGRRREAALARESERASEIASQQASGARQVGSVHRARERVSGRARERRGLETERGQRKSREDQRY